MRYLRALKRFKGTHELGERTSMPNQWKMPDQPPKPIKQERPRGLLPLKEDVMPYHMYDKIQDVQYSEFWDPKYKASVIKDRVDPSEEPFCSVYQKNESNEFTQVKNITTPELWAHVKRLARIKVAPRPTGQGPLPSGYVPPPQQPPDLPYFVPRTRNHLLPIYYHLGPDEESSYTIVKNITGDLWKFRDDLHQYLESRNQTGRPILTSVREPYEAVDFRGKHLDAIVDWLHDKGF